MSDIVETVDGESVVLQPIFRWLKRGDAEPVLQQGVFQEKTASWGRTLIWRDVRTDIIAGDYEPPDGQA